MAPLPASPSPLNQPPPPTSNQPASHLQTHQSTLTLNHNLNHPLVTSHTRDNSSSSSTIHDDFSIASSSSSSYFSAATTPTPSTPLAFFRPHSSGLTRVMSECTLTAVDDNDIDDEHVELDSVFDGRGARTRWNHLWVLEESERFEDSVDEDARVGHDASDSVEEQRATCFVDSVYTSGARVVFEMEESGWTDTDSLSKMDFNSDLSELEAEVPVANTSSKDVASNQLDPRLFLDTTFTPIDFSVIEEDWRDDVSDAETVYGAAEYVNSHETGGASPRRRAAVLGRLVRKAEDLVFVELGH
ncbi:hypothetical protein HDU79_002987 [Rhizoclosmatium sp. JEL0117]|nr:hypothetical protein HDU79_002987 [Rhizoclosmatium sp. JEL0117]